MKGTKFFGILMACVLAVFLVSEACFISVVLAGKKEPKYGSATLEDEGQYFITSDNSGPYIDYRSSPDGTEKVKGTFVKNDLERLTAFLGTYCVDTNPPGEGERRVCVFLTPDALKERVDQDDTNWTLLSSLKGELAKADSSAHARITLRPDRLTTWSLEIDLMFDAITRTAIGSEFDGYFFWDGEDCVRPSPYDQLAYTFRYPPGAFAVYDSVTNVNIVASPSTTDPVEVVVWGPPGQSKGKKGGGSHRSIVLATCDSAPLDLNVAFPSSAPRKHRTLSILWGEIRER